MKNVKLARLGNDLSSIVGYEVTESYGMVCAELLLVHYADSIRMAWSVTTEKEREKLVKELSRIIDHMKDFKIAVESKELPDSEY